MAELTTTAGEQIDFDPAAVTALADRDVATGEAATGVFGVMAAPLTTLETVVSLLDRLRLGAKVARLTRPDASPVWFVGPAVTALRAPLPDEYAPGVQAVLSVTGLVQGVMESLEQARKALDAVGAHL